MIKNLTKTFIEKISPVDDGGNSQNQGLPSMLSWTADFIENKGNGLIFLLHGKPGVGKTYTAECIAEYLHRPLLPITCADIGVDPAQVENNLTRWFKVAKSWGAIMLLDEADIYMEYRQIHDLTRNSLVAGFLRAIEYYEGIVFLTTNRIGTFDEAFLSRINVSIYYPPFTDEERDKIWNNYFEKIEREAGHQMHVPESAKSYATESSAVRELKWNGREIRNGIYSIHNNPIKSAKFSIAFQIAMNLAQAEGDIDNKGRVLIKRDHIKATVEMSKEFKEYMISLHKKTESQRAQIMGYRYDLFGDKETTAGNSNSF
jgi:SpoVK/Ycf46/Vps4 family AAA+-type ATPase